MKILTRYLISTYLRMLGLCLGSFVAIYLVIDILEKISRFAKNGPNPFDVISFFIWKVPEIVSQVLPLAVLMATMLALGSLARSSELTAMRSCGVSIAQITMPLLLVAAVVSSAAFILGEFVVPRTFAQMKYVEDIKIYRKNPATFFRQQNIWYRDNDVILQARLFEPATQQLRGVTIWRLGGGLQPQIRIEAENGSFAGSSWLFRDLVIQEFGPAATITTRRAKELPLELGLRLTDLKVLEKFADSMGFRDLRRYCDKLKSGGYDATRYLVQMHSRLSLPCASLVMAFLGIPFALRGSRSSGIAIGIGISIAIGVSYHISNAFLLSFGQAGALPPVIAAWAANFLFAASGVWLTMNINR